MYEHGCFASACINPHTAVPKTLLCEDCMHVDDIPREAGYFFNQNGAPGVGGR